MADANGLTPNDSGYDPSTDPEWGIAYGGGNPAGGPVQGTTPQNYLVSPSNGQGDGRSYDPNDPSTWITGTPAKPNTFIPNTPQATNAAATTGVPTGGSIRDPQYARQLVDYYGNLPGADPSLKANPDYWVQKMVSGEFGDSQDFAVDKIQNAWKTPATSAGGFQIDQSYLAPFTEKFQIPGDRSNPASAAFAANPSPFTLPTESDLFASPGFQGAQTAARNAVVNSNASKGLINSGGSIYDLANVAAGLEGQQYNDLVNQRANAYGINLGAGQQSFNDAWQQYLGRQNTFYANQTNPFNKLSTLANLGFNAASQ